MTERTGDSMTDSDELKQLRDSGGLEAEVVRLRERVAGLHTELAHRASAEQVIIERREDDIEELTVENRVLLARLSEVEAERDRALERLASLEAKPVVPRGWEVLRYDRERTYEWRLVSRGAADAPGPAAAYRALAWAIEHDAEPAHEDAVATELPVVPSGWTVHRNYDTWAARAPSAGAPMTWRVALALDWALRHNRRPPHEDAVVLEGHEYKSRRSSSRVIVDLVQDGQVYFRVVDPSVGLVAAYRVVLKDWEPQVVYPHDLEPVVEPVSEAS